jgi:hypothetical protein
MFASMTVSDVRCEGKWDDIGARRSYFRSLGMGGGTTRKSEHRDVQTSCAAKADQGRTTPSQQGGVARVGWHRGGRCRAN